MMYNMKLYELFFLRFDAFGSVVPAFGREQLRIVFQLSPGPLPFGQLSKQKGVQSQVFLC